MQGESVKKKWEVGSEEWWSMKEVGEAVKRKRKPGSGRGIKRI